MTFTARLRLPRADLLVSVEHLPELTTLLAQFGATVGQFTVRAQSSVGFTDQSRLVPRFDLSLGWRFDLPMPFLPIQGRLEGSVFIDENGNQIRDSGERGISEVILRSNGALARTDSSGFFRFPPVRPGPVELDLQELPVGLVATVELPLLFSLQAGEVRSVQIPLREEALISGLIYNDSNKTEHFEPGEAGLAKVRVVLAGPVDQETHSDATGRFLFQAPPGPYAVRVDESTLPPRFRLTTPTEVSIDAKAGEVQQVQFGAVEEMIIKFAPVADFVFSPEHPKAGESIVFDASASVDPDGEIIRYEWDFDGDGVIDALGRRITHVFAMAGGFAVTLRVTDDDDNQNSTTKTVRVAAKE
jgi:hypothetical protein